MATPEFANDGKIITLTSTTPGAWFRYTLDGTTPTRTRGYVYCGTIGGVQPDIHVQAIAYKSGMADSAVAPPGRSNLHRPFFYESNQHHFRLAALLPAVILLASVPAKSQAENPPPVCTRVRFQPPAGGGQDMVGAKIEGSNESRTEALRDAGGDQGAADGQGLGRAHFLRTAKSTATCACTLPRGGQGKLGKVEFYNGDKLIAGEKEGILVHYFLPDAQDDRTVGYDLVNAAAQRPAIKPDARRARMVRSTSRSIPTGTPSFATPWMARGPLRSTARLYKDPLHLDKTTTISAVAILPCSPPRPISPAEFPPARPDHRAPWQ